MNIIKRIKQWFRDRAARRAVSVFAASLKAYRAEGRPLKEPKPTLSPEEYWDDGLDQ